MSDEEEIDDKKAKWVKPPKPYEPEKPAWVNPNTLSKRERMDRRLEGAGLLNYQTQNLSADEIARRYANAGISVSGRSSWFKDNYGFDAPETITNRQKMFEYRDQARAGQVPASLFPTLDAGLKNVFPAGGKADRPVNYVTLENGLTVKAPKVTEPQGLRAVTEFGIGPGIFGTEEQARKGEINWTDMATEERTKILKDPAFYESGQITQYPTWMQQQILADPAFQWEQVPTWQRSYYELSSSPAGMGAVQGGLMGLIGGPVGGAVGAGAGATLGYLAGKSGYDATKEFWEQDSTTAGAFGLLNWLAEQAEKTAGMGFQIANAAVDKNKQVRDVLNRESWDAGASFFEVITPAWIEAVNSGKGEIGADDLLKAVPGVWVLTKIGDVIAHPEKYKGEEVYLGAESPMQLDQSWIERIDAAREEIKAGRPYREVMMDMQAGVVAQMGDMAGQAAADPLNVMPNYSTKIVGKVAEATGNKVAATALLQSEGLREAGSRYKNLVQTGQALTIDPNFKVDQMGRFSKWVAGINEQGQVKAGSVNPFGGTKKGLLDQETQANVNPSAKGFATGAAIGGTIGGLLGGWVGGIPGALIGGWIADKTGFLRDMLTQNPYDRAKTGAGMFYENIQAMMQMFDDPAQAGKYLRALANNDMNTWAELGSRFAESPEFYTVLPALKEFNTAQLDGVIQAWDMTAGNRDLLARVSDVMGENAGTLLEDLAKHGTAEQDFQRVVKKLRESSSPAAKALLGEVDAGTFTAETLKQMVDVFTGDGALPWHPGQWKAMMLDELGSHFDKWVTQRLMLDKSPEAVSAFYRTTALMKQAQSILLLGGSPGYAITNGLSNMVHRAVSGLGGLMTPGQINKFMDRFGVTPARLDEGVGIGGVVESPSPRPSPGGRGGVVTSEMEKAVRGKGALTTAKEMLGKLSKGMPFSKVSAMFERLEGRQAFAIGMKDYWSQSWRRGVGFSKMSGQVEAAIRAMGQDPNVIYAAIEAGMNQAEIERAVLGRQQEVQARSLIHDAATKTGMSASDAAQMLERMGVLDTLDAFLAGQTTPDGIRQAFKRAERTAQDWIDMRTGEDLKATAEHTKNRVGLEGGLAALDVSMKAHAAYTDVWMKHYFRMNEVMNDLYNMPDEATRNKAIDLADEISSQEFRRIDARNAANFKGVFDVYGLSGDPRALRVLDAIGEVGKVMGDAYKQKRENIQQWRQRWAGDLKNPKRWEDFARVQAQNSKLFEQAFKGRHDAQVKQGAAMAEIYESMHGPAAGEATRKWWEDVVALNDEMVVKEREFRKKNETDRANGVLAEEIAAAKQKYYSETKNLQIAELEKINGEGIARLERVIKGKGGGERVPVSGDPVPGGPSNVEGLRSQVEPTAMSSETPPPTPPQRESIAGEGSNAVDEVNALLAASEQRKGREASESAARMQAAFEVAKDYLRVSGRSYDMRLAQDQYALFHALRKVEYGGIPDLGGTRPKDMWADPRTTPELVRQVLENRKAFKESEIIQKVQEGEALHDVDQLYPAGTVFGDTLWQTEFDTALRNADMERAFALVPDEMMGQPMPSGETWGDFLVRVSDETATRTYEDATAEAVAGHAARAEESIRVAEDHAEAVTKRTVLLESLAEAFPKDADKIGAWGQVLDATAAHYARMTRETPDDFYNRYFGEVKRADGGPQTVDDALMQDAYHGSPYKFDKFTLEKIGAGEGNQAYGWGLYFAGDRAVADYYRQALSKGSNAQPQRFFNGQPLEVGTPEYHAASLVSKSGWNKSLSAARKEVAAWIKEVELDPARAGDVADWKRTLDILNQATSKKNFSEKPNAGQLYKVELPDENYLLWDKPLSEQPESAKGLVKYIQDNYFEEWLKKAYPSFHKDWGKLTQSQQASVIEDYSRSTGKAAPGTSEMTGDKTTGERLYKDLAFILGSDKAASLAMKEAGINGIQYLDGSSRGKGEGNFNYVIFDDAAVQIKETFYQKSLTPSPSPVGEGGKIPGTFDKGMVTFEDMKGTITAFERGDFSTVVHETGHIYRRMLADVAERTRNPYVLRDLQAVDEWAGVKDGVWDRAAEEKFARGFEAYIAEGKAPTPALVRAFEQFKNWMLEIYKMIAGSQIDVKLTDDVRRVFDRMLGGERRVEFDPELEWVDTDGIVRMKEKMDLRVDQESRRAEAESIRQSEYFRQLKKQAAEARRRKAVSSGQSSVDSLFQSEQPFGRYDEASGWRAESEGLDEGWRDQVRPLLRAMEEGAVSGVRDQVSGEGAVRDTSPEGQAMLRKYMRQVQNEMATTKLATVRHAERARDFALLNYSKRYGFDRMGDALLPYQLYSTRSLFTWAGRALDKPALYANYARLRMQQERYEKDVPERLRGKIRIPAPWLPEWAGDSLYIDPFRNLFFPENVVRYFERAKQEKTYQQIEAERVLQEWQADGRYSDAEILSAAQEQKGKVWERAWEEAQMRRESEASNPADFFTGFFGPAWYLSTPLNLAGIKVPGISKGDPNKVSTTPLGNTSRALDTVTQGTWAEPIGDLFGLIGKAEDWGREKFNLPTHGEYAEYYAKRQVANMVADGLISPEEAQLAMLEKSGAVWDQAVERVDMELALRVPLAGVTYAALHEGGGAALQAAAPSLFGASLLPEGELEFRGLKQEWNEAWKLADAGDTKAITNFFEEHPEYEAWLAKGKKDDELLQSFLVGQIWDSYMELGTTNQKQARAELGELFQQAFLDKETRSYESIPVEQLAEWTRLLGGKVPKVGATGQVPGVRDSNQLPPTGTMPVGSDQTLKLYPEAVTGITDQYFSQRTELFPNYYEEQSGYYALPKSERAGYLREHPDLKAYWDWKDKWYSAYPQYKPIFNGDEFDRVDTSGWMPGLEELVREAAYTGGRLPSGAQAALMNVWLMEGQPMDNFDTWVKSVVLPGMVYGR